MTEAEKGVLASVLVLWIVIGIGVFYFMSVYNKPLRQAAATGIFWPIWAVLKIAQGTYEVARNIWRS